MRAAYSRFFPLSTPSGCFDRFALFARIYGKIEVSFVDGFPKLLLRSKNRTVDGGMRAPIVGDRKRGAVGAHADFLDVIGFGGAGTGEMPVL